MVEEIFYLEHEENLKLEDIGKKTVITDNFLIYKKLSEEGIDIKSEEDYITKKDYEKIDDICLDILQSWSEKITKYISYEGLPLSDICYNNLFFILIPIVKKIFIFKNIIEKHKPKKIIIYQSDKKSKEIIRLLNKNIEIKTIDKTSQQKTTQGYEKLFSQVIEKGMLLIRKKPQMTSGAPVFSINNFRYYKNIISEIRKEKKNFILLARGLSAISSLIKKKIPFFIPADLENKHIEEITSDKKKNIENILNSSKLEELLEKIFSFQGLSFYSIIKEQISNIITGDFIEAIKAIEIAKQLAQKKPSCFVTFADADIFNRSLAYHFNKVKIPTIIISHGPPEEHRIGIIWSKSVCRYSLILGERDLKSLKKRAPKNQTLIKIGSPWLEDIKPTDNKINSKNPNLLFLPSPIAPINSWWSPFERTKNLYNFYKEASEMKNIKLVVKTHPSEDLKIHKAIAKKLGAKARFYEKRANVLSLIQNSDIITTESSTAGFEAILAAKPVLYINYTKFPDLLPYAERGAAIRISAPLDLKKAINLIVNDKKAQEKLASKRSTLINYMLTKTKKLSSKIAAEFILNQNGGTK